MVESTLVAIGGAAIAFFPEQACERMAALRGVDPSAVLCPLYDGANPVFETYAFSLGKHQALIALVFSYFAIAGNSKAAITLGLGYWAVAATLDVVPVLTWLRASDLAVSSFPGIYLLGLVFTVVAAVAIPANHRSREWEDTTSA